MQGALMGGAVGGLAGVVFGSMGAMSPQNKGNRLRAWVKDVPKTAVGSALTFGLFLGVGSYVRCQLG